MPQGEHATERLCYMESMPKKKHVTKGAFFINKNQTYFITLDFLPFISKLFLSIKWSQNQAKYGLSECHI